MSTIRVNIVSAEKELYSGEANMVVVPGVQGELGIHYQHAPLLTAIKPGEVRIKKEGQDDEAVFVAGGYIEVQPKLVTVLADTAIRASDIDEASARAAKEAAEQALAGSKGPEADVVELQNNLIMAAAQLEFVKKMHKR